MGTITPENQTEPATPTSGHTKIYVDSTTKKLTSKDDNGNVINYGLLSEGAIAKALSMNSSVVLDGCEMSVNAGDSGKFDISAGTYIIADCYTDPTQPDITIITYAGSTGNIPGFIATAGGSYAYLDANEVVQYTLPLDATDLSDFRDKAFLGAIVHNDGVNIAGINNTPCGSPINVSNSLCDLQASLGFINLADGNVYSGIPASLQIYKSSGFWFGFGINYVNDKTKPNTLAIGEFSPGLISYQYRDGAGSYISAPGTLTMIPNKYDDGTVATSPTPNGTVGADEWSVQRLYMLPNVTFVGFGQYKFNTKSDAIASINNVIYDENSTLASTLFRGWVVIKGDATDLDDTDHAEFFEADRFGLRINNKGLQQNVTTLQKAYENGMEPEIKVDSTRGSFAVQDADTPAGTDLIEAKRTGGTESAFKVDIGRMVSPTPAAAPADGDLDTSTATFYLDETNTYLKAKVKESDDSVHDFILSEGQPDSYGEMYEQGLATTITVTSAGTYYGWTTALTGIVAGSGFVTFTENSTSDRLTVGTDGGGVYRIDATISFSGSNSATAQGAIYKTGSREDKISFTRKLGVGGDVGTATCNGLLSLTSGDYIDFRFTSDGNGDTIVIENLNLSISRV